ncbi:MAG: glycosyltransferase family 4 protein [Acidimicrobiales bacterium]|nr:glycosyltransferase family 4 protein [Acidimicrobiales bacterium]
MSDPSVLLVHEFPGAFGGAERYLELLGAGLTAAGIATSAVVFVDDAGAAARLHDRLAAIAPDTRVVTGRSRPGPIRRAVRAHQPTVLHWNFVDPFAFRGASWLLLPWGRPSVITDHLPQLRHAGPHWEATRRLANRRIAAMIVVGEAARRAAAQRWARPPAIEVVPNGVPIGAGGVRAPIAGADVARLLFVGRLTEQKGTDLLVPVLEAVRAAGTPARLRVAGEGPQAGALAAEVAKAGLADQVDLVGFSPDPLAEMGEADVLLAPSTYEGLPFTPLEALSTGLPLVLSDIPPHVELAEQGAGAGAQVVAGRSPDDWARAVGRAIADLPAASRDALDLARAHDLATMVERTAAVYRRAEATLDEGGAAVS